MAAVLSPVTSGKVRERLQLKWTDIYGTNNAVCDMI